ncbi:MAG: hypothetical protein ACOYMG_26010 [Candidatus Methylumidiphilus sp.]
MSTLAEQILKLAHRYVRKGSKENRRRQVRRMLLFVEWVETQEAVGDLARLGKRHVINFWQANGDLSDKTRYGYWLALCVLWRWLEKPGKPPRPFSQR